MFIPTTSQEVAALGWDPLDVILLSGDYDYIGLAPTLALRSSASS